MRRALSLANGDDSVHSILLVVESPGGTVAGTSELAKAVASSPKPVVAYIEDMGASAAYWVASAATKVYANDSAYVGSIGTYMVIRDTSQAADKAGIKVHVINAGEFKGAGSAGTEVTDSQLAEFQRVINDTNNLFVEAVASHRGLDLATAKSLADGRIHLAAEAVKLGLIDGVRGIDAVLEEMVTAQSESVVMTI